MANYTKSLRLPGECILAGLRKMEEVDVREVTLLLNKYLLENYKIHAIFNEKEVAHWLLPRKGVVNTYVI